MQTMPRGALVVFEGLDRSGKSTQANLLENYLPNSKLYAFPYTKTPCGAIINQYLNSYLQISAHSLHLLFSANRWELQTQIVNDLVQGQTVILDRYYHSGFVYSQANGLPRPWIYMADIGLPAPDHVFFMDIDPKIASTRRDYGKHKYENIQYQYEVQKNYYSYVQNNWSVLDATLPVEQLHGIIKKVCSNITLNPMIQVFTNTI